MKKWLKRVIPNPKTIHDNRYLGIFGTLLHDPNLWHLNRRSVSGGVAIGLFVMYSPILTHSLIAAGLAILLRVNLPIAVALVWITNPFTIPPMFYFAYVVGCWILGHPAAGFNIHFWMDWHNWFGIMGPLVVGCLICGAVCSLLGYLTVQALWRWKVVKYLQKRRERYGAGSRLNTPSSKRQT